MWTRAQSRNFLDSEFYAALLPWLLRAGVLNAIQWGLKKICRGKIQDAAIQGQVLESAVHPGEQKIRNEEYHDLTWDQMRLRLGFQRRRLAVAVCVVRLLLCHWLQIILYWLVLWSFSEDIGEWQFRLGFCVGMREGIYFVLTNVGLATCPAYLLFSPARAEWPQLITYIVAPEKWLCIVCMWDDRGQVLFVTSVFMDMCAIGALIIGLVNGTMWTVLAIGYTVTAIGGLFAVFMVCCQRDYRVPSWWISLLCFIAFMCGILYFTHNVGIG